MRPILTPGDLERTAEELVRDGGTGFLLSGGCDHRGRVPLGPFLDTVRDIKARTGLAVNLHTGLVDEVGAGELLASEADAFSVDVVQDPRTIGHCLGRGVSPRHYARTLELLAPSQRLVPHVCVGLQSEKGEQDCLELIRSFKVRAVVVLGLMGTRGTPWEGRGVASGRLSAFVRAAVEAVDAPVLLGCMRPRGNWEVEVQCIMDGISGLVNPSQRTIRWAEGQGYEAQNIPACCALHL